MASVQLKHLVLLLAVPLTIAAATGLASGPVKIAIPEPLEPEDDHTRPAEYNEPILPDELIPPPSEMTAEYPLAVTFNSADPSNYTANGMVSYDYVVVHTMQGYYAGSQSWFKNPAANVSAHFVMRSSDGEVTQMVKLADRAWHVGNSNPYSIGIEHEGFIDEPAWYTWETYLSSALLSRWIADELDIPRNRDHIVGHVELPSQTHTDPGIHWNWDLYMTLINDFVGEGEIEGYVVDRGQACTLTATGDTWIKQTLQASSDLDDTQKCFIPAGTQFSYLHASGDLLGHRRLSYDAAGHPCDGFLNGLDEQGYAFAGHYSELCEESSVAAAGVTVVLDGGAQTVTDATGKFVFANVGPGAHTVDVIGNGSYADTLEPVDVEVFPGTRVIIALDPLGGPGDGDGDPSGDGDSDDGECWIGGPNCPCTPGGGCDPGLVCEAGTCVPTGGEDGPNGDGGETGINDPGIDYLEADTCACNEAQQRPGVLALGLLGLLGLRRRRA